MKSFILCTGIRYLKELAIFMNSGIKNFITILPPKTFRYWYKPEAISDFENYLAILKRMHSSDDLNLLINEARGHVGADIHNMMNEV